MSKPVQLEEAPAVSQLPGSDFEWFCGSASDFPTIEEVRATSGAHDARVSPPTATARFPASSLIVKWGTDVTIAEGQCLWFFAQQPAQVVPVPKVYGWRRVEQETFLYMGLVEGDTLEERWSTMSVIEKSSVCDDLRAVVARWSSLKRQTNVTELCQLGGQALRDIMFQDAGLYPAGPFPNIARFHQAFASLVVQNDDSDGDPRLQNEHLSGLDDSVEVVFTHGDLDQSNILVSRADDGPIRILAIVDWHQSGWYPKYWERLKAQTVAWPMSEWATVYLSSVLPPAEHNYLYSWEYVRMATI